MGNLCSAAHASASRDIFEAAGTGDIAAVRSFLDADPTAVRQRTSHSMNCTALHFAASEDHVEVAELLLAAGAPLDPQNDSGRTPLYNAAERNRIGVAKVLVAAGASPSVKNQWNFTPLRVAEVKGHSEILRMLEVAEADIAAAAKYIDSESFPSICQAAHAGDVPAVRRFVTDPAAVKRCDVGTVAGENMFGYTPLRFAAGNNHMGVARVLLAAGASPHGKDKSGKTPLDMAREKGYAEMIGLLEA
eukprot:Skav208867  [mRNA]  locus=scaffold6901:86170:86978:+ [translate_table: standard]